MDLRTPNPKLYNVPFLTDEFNGMPYRVLGKSGLRVSNVGLGTWKIGFPETGDGARVGEKMAFKIFDRAIELGVTHWDTANRYHGGSGNSERVIGKWLRSNPDQRRNIVLATKVFGGMDGVTPNHCRLSRSNIFDSVYASLERLQLDYVDILYFHRFDELTPVHESLEAVEDLIKPDLARYFAVSNFTVKQLQQYHKIAGALSNRVQPIAVQNQFDILHGESSEHPRVLHFCAEAGISFVAWSPLARGLLTARYLDPSMARKGDRLVDEGTLETDATPDILAKLNKLAFLANEWEMTLSQVTLAYMLTLPGMGPVIPSASTVEQLEKNAAAGKIQLTDEQLQQIKALIS